jgi:CelD/BcsL family acetyltransferase involved in cellulose biosynthesis
MTEVPHGIRPGIVLHAYAIKAAIAAGREEYDFLSGASQYKLQMSTATRPLMNLRASRPRYREDLLRLADRGVDLLRNLSRTTRRQLRDFAAKQRSQSSAQSATTPTAPTPAAPDSPAKPA